MKQPPDPFWLINLPSKWRRLDTIDDDEEVAETPAEPLMVWARPDLITVEPEASPAKPWARLSAQERKELVFVVRVPWEETPGGGPFLPLAMRPVIGTFTSPLEAMQWANSKWSGWRLRPYWKQTKTELLRDDGWTVGADYRKPGQGFHPSGKRAIDGSPFLVIERIERDFPFGTDMWQSPAVARPPYQVGQVWTWQEGEARRTIFVTAVFEGPAGRTVWAGYGAGPIVGPGFGRGGAEHDCPFDIPAAYHAQLLSGPGSPWDEAMLQPQPIPRKG